jgi:hypothetical protein
MPDSIAHFSLKKTINLVDWKLLLFLLLFLDVKLGVKIAAIVLIFLLRFDFKFGFSFKNSRLPLFYPLIMLIPFVSLIINKGYSNPDYLLVFLTGIGFWLLCILAIHQVKLAVECNEPEIIHRTIFIFFIINAVFSFCNFAAIVWETHTINPYRYQGGFQKYFIGTGDYIRGLTFDIATTNAALNTLGVIYFLIRKNNPMMLVCMVVLLFTGSNFLNMALIFILALLFIFNSTRNQKSIIVVCVMLMVIFMGRISPQNDKYAVTTIDYAFHVSEKPANGTAAKVVCGGAPTTEETKQQVAKNYLDSVRKKQVHSAPVMASLLPVLVALPKTEQGRILVDTADINSLPYQSAIDTTATQHVLLNFIDTHKASLQLSAQKTFIRDRPGKITSFLQTINFLERHPVKILTVAGIGNFSS